MKTEILNLIERAEEYYEATFQLNDAERVMRATDSAKDATPHELVDAQVSLFGCKTEALRAAGVKRILDVRTKSDAKRERSRVLLEPRLADLFRRVCSHLGLEADQIFEAMLALYIEQKTDLEMVFDPSPEAAALLVAVEAYRRTKDVRCSCQLEAGDSPCKIHGENDE